MKTRKLAIALILVSFCFGSTVFAGTDTYYNRQWYLDKIFAQDAWTVTTGSSSVIVAVLDTGVDIDHPDLQNNIWINTDEIVGDGIDNDRNGYVDDRNGYDFINRRPNPEPIVTVSHDASAVHHGTFIAGLISAIHDNSKGIKGVTSNVKIMPLVVLNPEGMGNSLLVADAIDYAVNNGADIINLSFGGDEHSVRLRNSIVNAYEKGVLIVAAAGNALNGTPNGVDMSSHPLYPICYDQEFSQNMILGVISSNKSNQVSTFSNYGNGCIDIAAPGEDIVSLLYHNTAYAEFDQPYATGWYGTSFANALVSGAAALLRSKNSNITPVQMIQVLTQNASLLFANQTKWTGKVGSGVLNIKKALDNISANSSTLPTPINQTPTNSTSTPVVTPATVSEDLGTVLNGAEILVSTKKSGYSSVNFYSSMFIKNDEIELLKGVQFQGLNIQVANVTGELKAIIVGATKGAQSFVRVLDRNGTILSSFLAFGDSFLGGVEVSAGDVDNDGETELVVAPESGYAPIVRIFNMNGQLEKEFLAYNKVYQDGVNVEVGDVDGDGLQEIITAPRKNLLPKIKIFKGDGTLKKEFLAYSPQFTGGVNISVGDLNGDNKADIITGAGAGGGPHVKAFTYNGNEFLSFFAYGSNFTGGVEVEVADWNKDGKNNIITAPGPGGGPHIKVWSKSGNYMAQFFPFSSNFTSGINIAVR